MGKHWTIDITADSALAICSHCKARFVDASRGSVMSELAEHLRRGHKLHSQVQVDAARPSTLLARATAAATLEGRP